MTGDNHRECLLTKEEGKSPLSLGFVTSQEQPGHDKESKIQHSSTDSKRHKLVPLRLGFAPLGARCVLVQPGFDGGNNRTTKSNNKTRKYIERVQHASALYFRLLWQATLRKRLVTLRRKGQIDSPLDGTGRGRESHCHGPPLRARRRPGWRTRCRHPRP